MVANSTETRMDDAKKLGLRLRNLLKHKKSHQWVMYEFFYANIDRTLLGGENEFRTLLKDTCPNLKSRDLTRAEWRNIRKMMGKTRRFSKAFLAKERATLSKKRQDIRILQQQPCVDVTRYRHLPDQIPLSLVIGTRVSALLYEPYFGLFNGVIDAVDTKSQGYRITFDRDEVGTHTVPDYEVLSIDQPEFLPLSSFQTRIKPNRPIVKSPKYLEILAHQVAEALGGKIGASSTNEQTFVSDQDGEGAGGQYPIKLLALMVRVSKMLALKKKRIYELKSMNNEVERLYSLEQEVQVELKRTYASTILDLEKLNNDLDEHLKAVQLYSNELTVDTSCILDPELIRQKCSNEAKEMVDDTLKNYEISNESSISMISQMMTLMVHLKSLAGNDDNSLQIRALNETMSKFKSKLNEPDAISKFEDNIELHINYIKNI